MKFEPVITEEWRNILKSEFESDYFDFIKKFLQKELEAGKTIYPPADQIFSAFNNTAFNDIKVVIIGQDPYHGQGQAHGMCFSVPEGIKPPPSLINIFKEINTDLGIPVPNHGNLTKWAKQGVFLLNTVLTVEQATPKSHSGKGWEVFTTDVIKKIDSKTFPVVFLLWGKDAKEFAKYIDEKKHFILNASHPAAEAYSNKGGFFGCRHFSRANEILRSLGSKPVDWRLD
jgi:uracil-DNA glycosylase